MAIVLSVILVVLGLTIAVRTLLASAAPDQEFPRFGAPARWKPRLMAVITGLGLALAGTIMLLLSLGERVAGSSP